MITVLARARYRKTKRDPILDVEDVGTGIGYVLPCLIAWSSPVSFVSQPELHLHPALQASLGDVLIDVAMSDRQSIVESHSEHMLLRLLRRVREKNSGRIDRGIAPADISIYYFDPQPDGATRIKRIRVSKDGDFIDRWPKGFFAERARELFDE